MQRLHQKLQLQHRRHTGKLLHHRHTSYRGLAVVFVVAAAAIAGLNILGKVTADSVINVEGTLQAPVPGAPAIIATPENSATLTSNTTMVAGSCPLVDPQVVVAVEVDGTRVGSSICDGDNDFSVPVSLNPGVHTLVARSYTITGAIGPDSTPVTVTYPVTQPGSVRLAAATTAAANLEAAGGTMIGSDAPFSYLGADQTTTWLGSFISGAVPYRVVMLWGDGTESAYVARAGEQQFSHRYADVQPYNLNVAVADATGKHLSEQFAVAAYSRADLAAAATGGAATDGSSQPFTGSKEFGLYGLFLTAAAVCAIVWLEARHVRREHAFAH